MVWVMWSKGKGIVGNRVFIWGCGLVDSERWFIVWRFC